MVQPDHARHPGARRSCADGRGRAAGRQRGALRVHRRPYRLSAGEPQIVLVYGFTVRRNEMSVRLSSPNFACLAFIAAVVFHDAASAQVSFASTGNAAEVTYAKD